MPLIVPVDAVKVVTDYVHSLLSSVSELSAYKVGTRVPDDVTPRYFIAVRTVGGTSADAVADRIRIDVRVWADGTLTTEGERSRVSRLLLAHLRMGLRCRTFATPITLPDPADATKSLSLFTIELLLRGVQA